MTGRQKLSLFAAGWCGVTAWVSAVDGNAPWTLLCAVFCAFNLWMANR